MAKWESLVSALTFALVYIFGTAIDAIHLAHRRRWVSVAAGVSVAYIFVHVMPELCEHQAKLTESIRGGNLLFAETWVYLAAMLGFVIFYGLDSMVVASRTPEHSQDQSHTNGDLVYWVHMGGFAVYSLIVGYLLVDWTKGLQSLILYTIALALHLIVVDHSLSEEYGAIYERGRWILAGSVLAGWLIGVFLPVGPQTIALLVGFTSGGVVINSIKDELPKSGEGRFLPFFSGALVYSILLALVERR